MKIETVYVSICLFKIQDFKMHVFRGHQRKLRIKQMSGVRIVCLKTLVQQQFRFNHGARGQMWCVPVSTTRIFDTKMKN